MTAHRQKQIINLFKYTLLIFILLVTIFPIYYMVTTSFKIPIQTYNPAIWIFKPTLENYQSLFNNFRITSNLLNSAIITIVSVLLSLVLGSLAAYGLAKYEFRSKEQIAGWMLSIRFLPAMVGVIPLFLLANYFKVIDSYGLLIAAYLTFNVPFATWMLRGFFEEIPKELEEAALVDGASHLQALIRIVVPLAGPGFFATSALLIIQTWNEFGLALFLATNNVRTMPTVTSQFQTVRGVLWGEMTGLGVLTTLPVMIFALLARKYLVRGLTFGALK
jgi:multiple sugar transport system permease protein